MRNNRLLWTLQGLLAMLFLFAGAMKLAMDPAELEAQAQMSGAFLQFIGVCELLGGIGLVVPWASGIQQRLTPLAAVGLVVIMAGAVVVTLMSQPPAAAAVPFVVGVLLAVIAYGRSARVAYSLARC